MYLPIWYKVNANNSGYIYGTCAANINVLILLSIIQNFEEFCSLKLKSWCNLFS